MLTNAIGIDPAGEENKMSGSFSNSIGQQKQESTQAWVQKEAMSMLRFKDALEESIGAQTGSDTDEGKDVLPIPSARRIHKFKFPRRLRRWLFLKRIIVQRKGWISILQFTHGSYDFTKVRRAFVAIYPEKVFTEYAQLNLPAPQQQGRPMKANWSYDPVDSDAEDDQHYTHDKWDHWDPDGNPYYAGDSSTQYPRTDEEWTEDDPDSDCEPDSFTHLNTDGKHELHGIQCIYLTEAQLEQGDLEVCKTSPGLPQFIHHTSRHAVHSSMLKLLAVSIL